MNKILIAIKPIIFKAGQESEVDHSAALCAEYWDLVKEEGIEKGRQEVARFANNFAGIKHNPEWQAKLKKWGIDDNNTT